MTIHPVCMPTTLDSRPVPIGVVWDTACCPQHGMFGFQSISSHVLATTLTHTMAMQSQLDPLPNDLPFRIVSKTIGRGAYAS